MMDMALNEEFAAALLGRIADTIDGCCAGIWKPVAGIST
jgi:hypothetical protein